MAITWLSPTTPAHTLTEPWEMHKSTYEAAKLGEAEAEVQLLCLWDQRIDILDNILLGGDSEKGLEWPYRPGSDVRAVEGEVRPFGAAGSRVDQGYQYLAAILTVRFARVGSEGGTRFTDRMNLSGEFQTTPFGGGTVYWEDPNNPGTPDTGNPVDAFQTGKLVMSGEWMRREYYIKAYPTAQHKWSGYVNEKAVKNPNFMESDGGNPPTFTALEFAPQTLLVMPPEIEYTFMKNVTGESERFNAMKKWAFRKEGWNTFYHDGEFRAIYNGANEQQLIYPTVDFIAEGILPASHQVP